ncbi:hypothetical protein TA3x_001623 [Tundrisphaera sp. TA3]|uniref:hypothetical protein n=1 Tax=Tundrisphaera sp. TA3 TaxID=3435775 RepID=UPI003EBEDC4C
MAAVRRTGAEPIDRLDESNEHATVERFVHSPADPEKWAAICLGNIRHANEGWADGFGFDILFGTATRRTRPDSSHGPAAAGREGLRRDREPPRRVE